MSSLFTREEVLNEFKFQASEWITNPSDIEESADIITELALDDFDMIEICMGLEDKFCIAQDIDHEKCRTVGDLIDETFKAAGKR